MERHNSLPNFAKRASRRFTTIEGWKNAGGSVYNAAGAGLRVLAIDPEFDSARYFDDYPQTSRRARSDRSSRSTASPSHHNSIDSVSMASSWGPVGLERGDHIRWDASSAHENLPSKERPMPAEKDVPPYHVFSKRQKWLLVIVIGVAGLFSGLSSNIYFPSLDAIAGVSSTSHFTSK
jgi:hypothetical protein